MNAAAAKQLDSYTMEDIYNLPDGQRAELIPAYTEPPTDSLLCTQSPSTAAAPPRWTCTPRGTQTHQSRESTRFSPQAG